MASILTALTTPTNTFSGQSKQMNPVYRQTENLLSWEMLNFLIENGRYSALPILLKQ